MDTKRRGLIAALLGILPVFRTQGQETIGDKTKFIGAEPPNPFMIAFSGGYNPIFEVGWDRKKNGLVVRADNREALITAKEIMDTLLSG